MKRFNIWATEKLYYIMTEIEARDEDEAKEKYMEMLEDGDIVVNESEILEIGASMVAPRKNKKVNG